MSDYQVPGWLYDMAQRVVDNNSGEWLTDTWIVANELLGSIDGHANDGHYEFVGLLIDEIERLREEVDRWNRVACPACCNDYDDAKAGGGE